MCSFGGLDAVVLCEITDQDVSVESYQRERLPRGDAAALAPADIAAPICWIVTDRRRVATIPFSAEAGSFGRITTLPSGCTKNLTRSPGFTPSCFRIALGMVA